MQLIYILNLQRRGVAMTMTVNGKIAKETTTSMMKTLKKKKKKKKKK